MRQAWMLSGCSRDACFHTYDGICWKVKVVLGDDAWLLTPRKEENTCDAWEHNEQEQKGWNNTTRQRVTSSDLLDFFLYMQRNTVGPQTPRMGSKPLHRMLKNAAT